MSDAEQRQRIDTLYQAILRNPRVSSDVAMAGYDAFLAQLTQVRQKHDTLAARLAEVEGEIGDWNAQVEQVRREWKMDFSEYDDLTLAHVIDHEPSVLSGELRHAAYIAARVRAATAERDRRALATAPPSAAEGGEGLRAARGVVKAKPDDPLPADLIRKARGA